MSELGKFIRVAAPVSLLAIALSGCAQAQTKPTVEEIRASLPLPIIQPTNQIIYTNTANPTTVDMEWQNVCKNESPAVTSQPPGPTLEWEKDNILNPWSPKTKLKISNLPTPNTKYEIALSAFNCTDYEGKQVNTDPVVNLLTVIYDTMPPHSEIVGYEARGGKLLVTAKVTDNLSGVENGIVQITVDNPIVGANIVALKSTDLAGNSSNQTFPVNYDPFNQIISMDQAKFDSGSGKIVISGSINDPNGNIDLSKTTVQANQDIWPITPLGLGNDNLDCENPRFQGYDFQLNCTPKYPDGKSTVSVIVKDRLGHEHTETYDVQIPPLSPERTALFYSLLTLSILSSSGVAAKWRGNIVQRNKRAQLFRAVSSGNAPLVTDAFAGLTKRDKKRFPNTVDQFNALHSIEELTVRDNLVEAVARIRKVYSNENMFLVDQRDKLLGTILAKINKLVMDRDWRILQKSEVKIVFDFLSNTFSNYKDYGFLWERIQENTRLSENIISAMTLYMIANNKMNMRNARMLGFMDEESLHKQIHILVGWKDFATLALFLEKLANVNDLEKKDGKISMALYSNARQIVDSAEEIVWRSIDQKLVRIDDIRKIEERSALLNEIKGQFDEANMYPGHRKYYGDIIQFQEKKIQALCLIELKGKELLETAQRCVVPEKAPLLVYLQERVLSDLKRHDMIPIFMGRTEQEIETFIDGYIAVHLIPLSFLVGSRYKFEGGLFTATDIPKPDRFTIAAYHEEGKVARTYKNALFTQFLTTIFTRLSNEYKNPEKQHKMDGVELTYEKWIPLHDAGLYGKAEISFIQAFLNTIGITKPPTHADLMNWYIKKLNLIAI